ncbi:hypothetical protein AKJ37_04710 [candidate division MSBL1 archaeon SCGC-AAA259I09]|uniref:Radical SAM core domain-containing protein n=2 Tax=candidate division MSBL1 TaxID=215777 RepID=A0A133UTI4_9EURY|nr:hypothetical protein AKJ37_04710 [candidate division MSBL1 archaeon SCGC-AAA259I09]KXA97459.1 hypothetical protein AKJ38_01175 [candidate division MSBL1 archaeon SCGC-AAA259I14]
MVQLDEYPRVLEEGQEPFDPMELAEKTREIVCNDGKRKYTKFYATGVYGGIGTGYTCGCCLRCVFCWVDQSRDYPERMGEFYSPEGAFEKLSEAADNYGTEKLRVSGAEPTLCRDHLLRLLELVEESDYGPFILETNGILFGSDESYVKEISRFEKPHVRVSLKAGTPEAFEEKTGGSLEAFELPFMAIRNLLEHEVSFHVAGMMDDPRIVSEDERKNLAHRLEQIHPALVENFEGEVVDPYDSTLKRLEAAGFDLSWPLERKYPPLRKEI